MIISVAIGLFISLGAALNCEAIQGNGIAQLVSCQLNSPPLPLDWQFQFILKYAYYWNGVD